jgi:hypothetical protein
VTACGDCFRWAFRYAVKHPKALVVHGTVQEPLGTHRYPHAWVTHRGRVKDWQTMEAGFGGKWQGKGYPLATFQMLWKPQDEVRFTAIEAIRLSVKTGHYGPF